MSRGECTGMYENISVTKKIIGKLKEKQSAAQRLGNMKSFIKARSLYLFLAQKAKQKDVAKICNISTETLRLWVKDFMLRGMKIFEKIKPPGRPAKLTKSQRQELEQMIDLGPQASDYSGGCWRSPMIQDLIQKKFGVFYNVYYIAELLKSLNYSFQKARFVAANKDEEKRKNWLEKTWPEILKLSQEKNSYILFGDEASFPQWGSLSYTWAKKGVQPTIQTSGKRKGYKVFGLIDYCTGRFFSQSIQGKFTSDTYSDFLRSVIAQTRKHLIIIQDGARYHTSKQMKEFFQMHSKKITIFQMPSYSPDYNPIEKLWKQIKQHGTHLVYFPTFESLIKKVDEMLVKFKNVKEEVLDLFGMYKRRA